MRSSPCEVTTLNFETLGSLYLGPMTLTGIAAETGAPRRTLVDTIHRLESDGYTIPIGRVQETKGPRSQLYSLTRRGHEVYMQIQTQWVFFETAPQCDHIGPDGVLCMKRDGHRGGHAHWPDNHRALWWEDVPVDTCSCGAHMVRVGSRALVCTFCGQTGREQ